MESLIAAGAPWPGAVAVSGGGDSVALMHLLARWADATGRAAPFVLTVDHGLRDGSAVDARKVKRLALEARLASRVLRRKGPRPTADIEAAARDARYRLMGDWAKRNGFAALYVAHTGDDLVETFLLRLMRGSGLDGLAAMRALSPYPIAGYGGLGVVRPLLSFAREDMRSHLSARGIAWLEDPMNQDDRFARVRVRNLLPSLEAAGLTRARIADAAIHLARARESLDLVTGAVLARIVQPRGEMLHVDLDGLVSAPREVALRALAHLLMRVSGQTYRPRFERLERLFDRLCAGTLGGGATLHGCRIFLERGSKGSFGPATLAIARETGRSREKPAKPSRAPHEDRN
jgi:tRNA(Ile)-lysidine synthase